MPSIYDLKPKFQNLLRPTVKVLSDRGVSANQITVLAMIISFIAGSMVLAFPESNWPLLIIPLVLFIRMALNAIDGMLAREHNMKSSLGAVLNELGDVCSDVALYLPLAVIAGIDASLIVLVVVFTMISEMAGVIAIQIGAQRRYDGPMGKSDRAFLFGVIALIIGAGINPHPWLNYLLITMLILLVFTTYNRVKNALQEVE